MTRPSRAKIATAALTLLAGAVLSAPHAGVAQSTTPRAVVASLGLDQSQVGRVTAHFAPADRARTEELAALVDAAAALFERELALSFAMELAALGPDDWFSEFPAIPYAIPWVSMNERLLLLPSSLSEGVLIQGPNALADRRRVDFVALHEYGHVAAKEYFRPGSAEDYIPVPWFEELIATYFAFAYVASAEPAWAEAAKQEWLGQIERFKPSVRSLDWGFMAALPGPEFAQTYGWYQFLLNLQCAKLYESHGLDLLPALKGGLQWDGAQGWTSNSVLDGLEELAPRFTEWAREFGTD